MTSQIQRGLTRFRTWSHTRWCFVSFVSFFFFFPLRDGSITHIFAHTCARTQTDICYRPETQHKGALKRSATRSKHGMLAGRLCFSSAGLNILLQDYGQACWELTGIEMLLYPNLSSPNPLSALTTLPFPPPKKNRAGQGWKVTQCQLQALRSDILHPSALAALL